MRLNSPASVAAAAALVAAAYAATVVTDPARADASAPQALGAVHAAQDPAGAAPTPRECRIDAGIDSNCTFN